MFCEIPVVTISELLRWLRLMTTKVPGLTNRGILTPSMKMYTTPDECLEKVHQDWLRRIGIGARQIELVDGEHPVQAVLTRKDLLDELARDLKARKFILAVFEVQPGSNEELLGKELAQRMGVDISDFWAHFTLACDPAYWHYGKKAKLRKLAEDSGLHELFLPYQEADKSDAKSLHESIIMIQGQTGCEKVLVRVDGEATGDGQMVYPVHTVPEITRGLSKFSADKALIEPFVEHTPFSVLIFLDGKGVRICGFTDQLMCWDPTASKVLSAGNLLVSPDMPGYILPSATFRNAGLAAEALGEMLWLKGVRGPVSLDLLALKSGKCYVTEANIRMTNGFYAWQLQNQVNGVASLSIFKPGRRDIIGFSSLRKELGELMYNGSTGLIPVVTTILPNQCHVGIVGRTLEEIQYLMDETWKFLKCEGEPPRFYDNQLIPVQAVNTAVN